MTCILFIIALFVLSWLLAYVRARLSVWTLALGALLALLPVFAAPASITTAAWISFVVVALVLNLTPLRRAILSRPIFAWFKRALPAMSRTEQEAIEAGTVWWDGELFSGKPNWRKLLAIPAPKLSTEEQAFLDGPVEQLCTLLDDWHITHERADLPPDVWRYIKEQRFFGMIIPKQFGGLEFSALAHSSVVMKVASRSITAAVTVMVPNSLGPAELLLRYGTDAQKNHYLPRLARGEDVPCFALTGPEAGSDASSIPDTGIVCHGEYEGKIDVLGIRLTWEKRYITLGPVATVLGLAFKLHDPDQLLGDKCELGITLALIPTSHPGVNIGRRHFPLNMAFQNGPNWGKDVFIPMDWVIGGQQYVGQGWRMLMECLAAGRSISLPALSTGGGKLAARATGAYARIRKQFKVSIGAFEGVEEALARIAANAYLMEAARVMTAGAVDAGERPSVVSAIAKYHLTERLRQSINDAMDVQGGSGICMGPRNLLARIYQSIPISITVEGANILTRSLIIFGQGAIRCHPYVYKEMQAAVDSDGARGLRNFDQAFFGHLGFTLSNAARTLWLGLTGARFACAPVVGVTQRYYQQLTRLSSALAFTADVAMLMLGGALKRKERLSARLGDVLSCLYLASTVLKRYEDDGRPADDAPLVRWVCDDLLYRAQDALQDFLRNFPNRLVARALGWCAFPWGRSFAVPSDRQGHSLARLLLKPSTTRDRLTAGIFVPNDDQQTMGRIEDALRKVIAAEPAEKALTDAIKKGFVPGHDIEQQMQHALQVGALTTAQVDTLRAAHAARRAVIQVDDFAPEYLSRL
jgi:acyl-CoA dehydrogenase